MNIPKAVAIAAAATLLQAPAPAAADAGHSRQADLIASIEARWGGVMTRMRGWTPDSFRQFREGYGAYPVEVLEAALASYSFEEVQATLDAHSAVRARDAMAKAMRKSYPVGLSLPEDTASEQVMEAKRLAVKALGDDARDLVFIPITPCTVWDTRFATDPNSAGIINNAQTKKFYSHLDGAGGSYAAYGGNPSCPETAQNFIGPRPFAVMMTVYVNDASANGWLTFYRDGDADPSQATISVYYSPGPTRTQTVIAKSNRGYGVGTYDIAATSRFGNANASASVTGYFVKVQGAGTVTSVATGAGLTGGPITTSGTINLAATNLLPTVACATNEVARWNGSAWVCAPQPTSVMSGRVNNPASQTLCLVGAPTGVSTTAPCSFPGVTQSLVQAPAGWVIRNVRAQLTAADAVSNYFYLIDAGGGILIQCSIPAGSTSCVAAGPSNPLVEGAGLAAEFARAINGVVLPITFTYELAPN